MPIDMYFDDYETGNSIGSHSGIHKLEAVYIILQSIPPTFQGNLKNIFMAMLLHHDNYEKVGNGILIIFIVCGTLPLKLCMTFQNEFWYMKKDQFSIDSF